MILVYITIGLYAAILIWHFTTVKYINPYTMDLYIGNKGCGKSSTMAKMIKEDIKRNVKVYANAPDIKINDVRVYDTFNLGHKKVTNATIYVDEVSLFFDNRNYKNTSKEFIAWLREVRHNKLKVKLFTQSYDCDKKIRTMCDNIYIGTRILRVLTIWRRLRKNVAIKEEALTAESQIVDELNFTPLLLPGSIKITFIPRYIKYFDSFKDLQEYHEYLPFKRVKNGIEIKRLKPIKKKKEAHFTNHDMGGRSTPISKEKGERTSPKAI